MKLAKLGIVMLGVSEMARALAFYRDQLGLTVQQEIGGEFTFLDAGGVTLALSVPLAKALGGAKAGATEFVFQVDDVTAAHAALCARGVVFKNDPRNVTGSLWAANFTDPDGHHLSILGPHSKPAASD
jgi:catechol 2,3-dioxygenase-like lactoylglutathione lyase family enzyme